MHCIEAIIVQGLGCRYASPTTAESLGKQHYQKDVRFRCSCTAGPPRIRMHSILFIVVQHGMIVHFSNLISLKEEGKLIREKSHDVIDSGEKGTTFSLSL